MQHRLFLLGIALAVASGCSGSSGTPSPANGGATGQIGTGGNTTNNGTTGGAVTAGGNTNNSSTNSQATGGNVNSGTSAATGGASSNPSTGGGVAKSSTGGGVATSSTGGSTATSSTGGATATSSTGGKAAGGSTTTGGTTSTGGTAAASGKANSGGTTSIGGTTTGAGGKAGTGGTTSTSTSACSREMLQTAVTSYIDAMKAGDYTKMSLTSAAKYSENATSVALGQGIWATALTPDLTRSLLDVDKCASFTEVIVATGSHPYVLGTRLTVQSGQISAISVIATDCDDWGFNAADYLKNSKAEDAGWGAVAEADRLSRQELQAAGDAYFAYWADKTVVVPWGTPCARLEGGMYTGTTCNVGIPDQNPAPKANDYLIDVDYNMVVLFLNMPGPDSHWFRVNKSGIRYVHTLTVCYVNGKWQCPGTQPTCK